MSYATNDNSVTTAYRCVLDVLYMLVTIIGTYRHCYNGPTAASVGDVVLLYDKLETIQLHAHINPI